MTMTSLILVLSLLGADRLKPPTVVPDTATIALDDIGLYAVGYAYRGQPERTFPLGWNGPFDDKTGVTCQEVEPASGRRALLMHCPWRGGTGVTFQEYRFQVPPEVRRVVLRGATAMRPDALGRDKSDGVTFRVFANGEKLLDEHRMDASWKAFEFDLTARARPVLTLRFETDPGPKDNASFDFSIWGDRQIVFEGLSPRPPAHAKVPALGLRPLGSHRGGGATPPSGFPHRESFALEGDAVVFRYAGDDGTITYRWSRPTSGDDPVLGRLVAEVQARGGTRYAVPLATTAALQWTRESLPGASRWKPSRESIELERAYTLGGRTATLRVTGRLAGKSLVLDVACDQSVVSRFDAGGWGPMFRRRAVPVPYLSGEQVEFLPNEDLFVGAQLDWTASAATIHENSRALYQALTDGSRNRLAERAIFTAAWHLDEVLPNVPNAPSPFLKDLADRVVLDVWGGRYEDIAAKFAFLADHGITRCVALIHDWQRSGYDNALPAHIPAAADKGGDPGMKILVATGNRLGYRVALHENYVDYYPNYEGFKESDIALDSQGHRQNAWYNPGPKIQSFAVQPNAILPLAATQSPEIHRRYGTNADYLDVHSSVPPWFHVDQRAGENGAGQFRRVWGAHTELWNFERTIHGGPVFGEGNNHWYWSGLLDGAEAQFGSGWPGGKGETAPLLVDFDLLKIHPLQLNHGMGYYERWWDERTGPRRPLMSALDQYRMQEVAFAHAGFLGAPTWSTLPLAWLEHHLLAPVMARYATATPLAIEYESKGRWVDASSAVREGGDFQRVRVRYDNGLTVTANQAVDPLDVGGLTLPRFGWTAAGAGVTAGTTLRDGVVSDYAATADGVFANARDAAAWDLSGRKRIRPTVTAIEPAGPRAFRFVYRWQVRDRLPDDHTAFVHFGKPDADNDRESILFQQDHAPTVPTSKWRPGSTVDDGPHTLHVPDGVPDGDYAWLIGLLRPSGERVALEGDDTGARRIRLGTLRVGAGGHSITFEPIRQAPSSAAQVEPDRLNHDSRVLDFGPIRTNGSLFVQRVGQDWVAQVLPREGGFTVQLHTSWFGRPTSVQSPGGRQPAVTPSATGDWWNLPLNEAREYRWPAQGG